MLLQCCSVAACPQASGHREPGGDPSVANICSHRLRFSSVGFNLISRWILLLLTSPDFIAPTSSPFSSDMLERLRDLQQELLTAEQLLMHDLNLFICSSLWITCCFHVTEGELRCLKPLNFPSVSVLMSDFCLPLNLLFN